MGGAGAAHSISERPGWGQRSQLGGKLVRVHDVKTFLGVSCDARVYRSMWNLHALAISDNCCSTIVETNSLSLYPLASTLIETRRYILALVDAHDRANQLR